MSRPATFGAFGATDAEIDAAINFGPVPEDDPSRKGGGFLAKLLGGMGTGAATGAAGGPIGAAVGAVVGAAPAVFGLVAAGKAKRGTLIGMIAHASKVRGQIASARRPKRRAKLIAKYAGLLGQIKVAQQQLALLEQQAIAANRPIPTTPPPYALYSVVGTVILAGGAYVVYRRMK